MPRLVSDRLRRAKRASIGGSTREKSHAKARVRPSVRTVPAYGFTASIELGQSPGHFGELGLELRDLLETGALNLAPQSPLV